MTNRELLKFAAKAAGYDVIHHPNSNRIDTLFFVLKGRNWNPLEDDGDALRLAVKLGIRIDWIAFDVVCVDFNSNYTAREYKKDDPYSATRRAIVRIAAEIGKSMN